ncbi:MAG: L-seryl-tRNA(Sec) selenium transferase [Geodermatophilaceae bacterium]|nr:L-seryl-tRNA(Sec) selenium transferase [Geodermatophilaceae bacterium]
MAGDNGSHSSTRRHVPRTDDMLADPRLAQACALLGRSLVKRVVVGIQNQVRAGTVSATDAIEHAVAALPETAASLRPVLNATGVLVHTNLGRAALSPAAVAALVAASGTTDVELDLRTGRRGRRGQAAIDALCDAVPAAQAAHVVNNGAAAVLLAATALAQRREIVIARGELVEIGDGFRIPDLLVSTGARLREVGTTNRVTLEDYAAAVGPETGFVLKVHPSNFVVRGFTSSVEIAQLSTLPVPVVADIGSGLLVPHPVLPDEPDAQSALAAGAALVTASGDKLLGGPQAGVILGQRDLVELLRRHPLARAVRVDKLTLAALEATVRGPRPPVLRALEADVGRLRDRAQRLANRLQEKGIAATAVDSLARVGGGGAPEATLSSAAVSLPATYAAALRAGEQPVIGRTERDRCLLDLRALDADDDAALYRTVIAAFTAASAIDSEDGGPGIATCTS